MTIVYSGFACVSFVYILHTCGFQFRHMHAFTIVFLYIVDNNFERGYFAVNKLI